MISMFTLLYVLLAHYLPATTQTHAQATLPPVILVPGYGGSQLEAKLNKPHVTHLYCKKQSDWYDLWLNLLDLTPLAANCFVDNVRLVYDPATHRTSDSPGVQVRVPGFGNTSTVEYLDPDQLGPTTYYYQIAKALVDIGYKRNVNLRGAPFDWRKAANELGDWFQQTTKLIEETYMENGNQRVVLIGHSMGNQMLLYLLNHKTQDWKDKHIKSYIDMSGPLGGSVKTLLLLMSGFDLNDYFIAPLVARPMERSFPGTMWLVPDNNFWNSSEILVYTPNRNYTVDDYKQLFTDMNYTEGIQIRADVEPLIKKLTPPGVETHCIHGVGKKTRSGFVYEQGQFPDKQPGKVLYGPGDGTVNLRSLHSCLRWQGKQKQKVYHKEFQKVDHLGILKDKNAIEYIKQVVQSP